MVIGGDLGLRRVGRPPEHAAQGEAELVEPHAAPQFGAVEELGTVLGQPPDDPAGGHRREAQERRYDELEVDRAEAHPF